MRRIVGSYRRKLRENYFFKILLKLCAVNKTCRAWSRYIDTYDGLRSDGQIAIAVWIYITI